MNRSTLVSTLALCGLLAAGNAVAQIPSGTSPAPAAKANKPTAPGSTFGASGGKDPVKIDADRLDVFDRENKAIFAGNVVAVQGDSTIRCSTMTVHYKRGKDAKPGAPAPAADGAKSPAGMAENGIQKVECAGPVTVVQNDQVATGDNAVFDQEAKRIVLTGNVVLSQCQNVTRGSRLVYDMNTGRANMDPVAGGRVSAMFVPQKEEAAKGGAKGCAQPASAAGKPAPKPSEASADKPTAKPRAQAQLTSALPLASVPDPISPRIAGAVSDGAGRTPSLLSRLFGRGKGRPAAGETGLSGNGGGPGILHVEGLRKSYGARTVVHEAGLTVRNGEAVGLLGPNGAGKTTIFYMITGLVSADRGSISLDGLPITHLPMYQRARLGIGYLPQEASIFRGLSVEDNIRAVLEVVEPNRKERERKLDSLLEEFDIARLRKSPSIALSGGERRRCEIARALATSPSFMLLDEPFAGIDPIAVGDIQDLVKHLKQRGIGVLITDHNVRETLGLIDRAYIAHSGRILTEGTPAEIVANEDARRLYLGEDFRL